MTEKAKSPDQGNKSGFSVFIAGADLDFRQLTLPERHVETDQVLRKGGYNPTPDHRLVELTFPGTKSWDDDETIDLKSSVPRRFVVGKSDRLYAFVIDDLVHELPFAEMGEPQLRKMACIGDDKILVLAQKDQPDRELGPEDMVSFVGSEVERLFSSDAMVTVCLDNKGERKLPRGSYMFKDLVVLLDIPAGYHISYVNVNGKLVSFKEGEPVELFDGIKFFAYPASGGAA